MKLEQSFEVDAPLERVWSLLLDIERVAPCLPGAGVEDRNEDGSYAGRFKVKIGPTTASYRGTLAFEKVDEAAHTATIQANGTDRRGQGGARATIVSTLRADGDRTRVQVDTEYHITGRLARFGRGGMVEDIAERLLREFAQNLQTLLQGGPAAPGPGHADSGAAGDAQRAESGAAPHAEEPGSVGGAGPRTDAPTQAESAPAIPEALDAGALLRSVAWQRARSSLLVPGVIVLLVLLAFRRRRRR